MPPEVVPPPWRLRGRGYVFAYSFPEAFVQAQELPSGLRGALRRGPGAVMLVDYAESPVGPYHELLFLAGRYQLGGSTVCSIPCIFVSSERSVVSGRANWGLPKQQAEFSWTEEGERQERVRVAAGGSVFFDALLERGVVPFPVFAPRWPLPLSLVQPRKGRTLVTTLRGAGLARRARLRRLRVDGQHFPDTSALSPWLGLRIAPFRLVFPAPREGVLRD